MKIDDISVKELNKELTDEFREIINKLAELLKIEKLDDSIIVEIQEFQSKERLPKNVGTFGIFDNQEDKIIISNIYFTANRRTFRDMLYYVLVREAIRRYLAREFSPPNNYSRLFFITYNLLAALLVAQDQQITSILTSTMRIIRSSTSFRNEQLFKINEWDRYLQKLLRNKTSFLIIVQKLGYYLSLAKNKNWSQAELTLEFCSWLDIITVEEDFLALPLFMTERHFQITNMLVESGMMNSSAIKLAEKFGLKHDVINTAFIEMYENYNLYWRPNINYQLLKLYPYYFRVTLNKKQYKSMLLEKLKSIPYITTVYEGLSDNKQMLSCLFHCPHIVHNQLDSYFENLKNKDFIHDYFFQLLKGRALYSSITTEKLKQSLSTYKQLVSNPTKFNFQTITLLDEMFDYSNPPKEKKAVFDKNILNFISVLRTKTLQKGVYMCYVNEMLEFCQKNNRPITKTGAAMDFINQMDIRCRRLGLYDYFLNIKKLAIYKEALCFELLSPPTAEILEHLEKLKFASNMFILNFYDRVLVNFPRISLKHPFSKIAEDVIRKTGIDYLLYSNERNPDLYRYIPYHDLYDFEANKWIH